MCFYKHPDVTGPVVKDCDMLGEKLLMGKFWKVAFNKRMIAVGEISFRKRRIILFRLYGTVITNVKINIKYL